MNISDLRKEYRLRALTRESLSKEPVEQFRIWLAEAIKAEIIEPTAMALATCDAAGHPYCRMVLLKHFDKQGFTFFTNLESRKARQLKEMPVAAATFWWRDLERQVLLEGKVERVSNEEAASYFAKRPRQSQLGAWASKQSSVVDSRRALEVEFERFENKFKNKEIPLPPFWGGFRIVPERFEFWQGRESRLHDRFRYEWEDGDWKIDRLAP